MASDQATESYRFGVFELSRAVGLRRNGVPIKLQPQPYQILLLLVERAGEIVRREEIQRLTWPEDTLVDFEVGTNRCIRQIRTALKDDGDAPRYLETVPRVGYRFIAPVRAVAPVRDLLDIAPVEREPVHLKPEQIELVSPAVLQIFGSSESAARRRRRPGVFGLYGAMGVAVLVSVATWMWSTRSHLGDLATVPLAVFAGYQSTPTFSPDGRQVAFVWNGEQQNNFDIYVKQVNSPLPSLRLTRDEETDYSPAWSPDGEWIAFCRGTDKPGGAIWLIPALGGTERKLVDLNVIAQPTTRTITWTADSKNLIVTDAIAGEQQRGLHVLNIATRVVRQLTRPAAFEDDVYPAVSWNNKWVAFGRAVARGPTSILLASLADGRIVRQIAGPPTATRAAGSVNVSFVWTPDSSHLVFTSQDGGNSQVWMSEANGSGTARPISSLGSGIVDLAMSANGQLALAHAISNSNIWSIGVAGSARVDRAARPFLRSTRLEETPAVTGDGRVVFASNLSGYREIWSAGKNGTDLMQLTYLKNLVSGSPSWSPDGRSIVFDTHGRGFTTLYRMAADGSNLKLLCCKDAPGLTPAWSPDGKWIYYSSNRTGRLEIWRMPESGGASEQITHGGGFAPAFGEQGRALYYTQTNGSLSSLWKLKLSTGVRTLIEPMVIKRAYAGSEDGVYYFVNSHADGRSLLYFAHSITGAKTLVFAAESQLGNGIALSPDGRTLYVTQLDQSGTELSLAPEFWR